MVKIGIAGVPGTGKTSVSRELSHVLGLRVVSVNEIARKFGVGDYKGSLLVDVSRLEKELMRLQGDFIIEGHLLCVAKAPVDYLFVLRCHPKELADRLRRKGWDEDKINVNIEAEALDYCLIKAEEIYKSVCQVDTTGLEPSEVASKIVGVIQGRGKGDTVDWSQWLFSRL